MTDNDGVYLHGAGHMYRVLHSAHIDGRPLARIEKVGNGSAQCSAISRVARGASFLKTM